MIESTALTSGPATTRRRMGREWGQRDLAQPHIFRDLKVLFLIRRLDLGGVQRYVAECATGLREKGCEVTVLSFYGGGMFREKLAGSGVRVRSLEKSGRWDIVGFLWRFIRVIREERPDIVFAQLNIPNVLSIAARPFVPPTRIVWSIPVSDLNLGRYNWMSRLFSRLERYLSNKPDLIISVSQAGKQACKQAGFPDDKIVVLPLGVDVDYFDIDAAAGERMRREWGVSEDEKLVGIVGRLAPVKDHAMFVEAATLLAKNRPDVRFVSVGDGPAAYRQKLIDLSTARGLNERLIWLPACDDMRAAYNALDLLCLTSTSEALPSVLCEAAACGVPCVATDTGDCPKVVEGFGRVVPVGNAVALAGACQDMLALSPGDGASASQWRDRIILNFSKEQMVSDIQAAFDGIMSETN
jgi:glycosyltransferase involved in cell wall biosynthesis